MFPFSYLLIMLPDKFKEDRFERSSTPSKNNQLLVSHCTPSVHRIYLYFRLKILHYMLPIQCEAGGLMVTSLDTDLAVRV